MALRFRPDPAETSTNAQADKLTFENTIDNINLDNRIMDQFPLNINRWNFNVSLVFRMFPEQASDSPKEYY